MVAEKDGKKTGSTRISLSCMIPVVIYTPVYMIRVKYLTSRRLRSGRLWCTVNYAICCNSWCSYIGCEHWRPAPPSNIGSDVQLDHNSTRTSCPFLEYLRIAQRMHTPQHLQGQSLQVELSWGVSSSRHLHQLTWLWFDLKKAGFGWYNFCNI